MTELYTVLAPDGKVRKKERPSLSDADILLLHRAMVRTRALDGRGLALQRQGRLGFYLPSTGEEAAQVGSAFAIEADDWVAPSYRQPGVFLLRNITPEQILDNCFGNASDTAKGRQMPVHYSFKQANMISISSPIGTQIVHGTGVAMGMAFRKDGRVCLTYMGDGGTSSNDFHTGLNFAGVYNAPCVFACINNQWAISLPVDGQTGSRTIAQKAEAYGMPSAFVDGNDVFAVYNATRDAVARARRGEGPTLLEFLTFRMGPHSSSDDPSRYRPRAEEKEWAEKCPIARLEAFLVREELLSAAEIEAIHGEAEAEMATAAKASESKPAPPLESLFEDVYSELPAHLVEQRDQLLAEGGDHAADQNAAFPL